jgi:hypothetical protein
MKTCWRDGIAAALGVRTWHKEVAKGTYAIYSKNAEGM